MNKIFVLGNATIFFVYGLLFIVIPMETFQLVVDSTVNSSSGITDIRATYGGMSVGIGVILYLLGKNQETLKTGLISVGVVMLGMATGRAVGIAIDGDVNSYMYMYLAFEIAASLIAAVLYQTSTGR